MNPNYLFEKVWDTEFNEEISSEIGSSIRYIKVSEKEYSIFPTVWRLCLNFDYLMCRVLHYSSYLQTASD